MTPRQIEAILINVPLRAVMQAYQALTGNPAATKADACRALAQAVSRGVISIEDIKRANVPAAVANNAPSGSPEAAALHKPVPPPTPSSPRLVTQVATEVGKLTSAQALQWQTINTQTATINAQAVEVQKIAAAVAATDKGLSSLAFEVRNIRGMVTEGVAEEVRSAVAQAIQPLIRIAENSPEVAQTIAVAVAGPTARRPALEVFGIDARDARGNPLMFEEWNHPEAPPVDSAFIWTEPILRALYLMQETGRNAWLGGPAGTGKTQTIQQFAARTGRLFRRFVFDRLATREDYLGATGLESGDTVFQQGPVLDAYTTPGSVCLLDEAGMANPAALSSLNGFLEPGARMAYADRVWLKAPGVLFAAADNSLTQGDQSGRFAGVQTMNTAFSERFAFVIPFKYLDEDTETDALVRHAQCTAALARHVVEALTLCRSKVDSGDVIDPPSIRQAIAFIQACRVLPVEEAWHVTIAARQPAESSVGLAAVYAAAIDASFIAQEI